MQIVQLGLILFLTGSKSVLQNYLSIYFSKKKHFKEQSCHAVGGMNGRETDHALRSETLATARKNGRSQEAKICIPCANSGLAVRQE